MKFKYCPDCGAVLVRRDLGDEKDVPWCDNCSRPWFEIFPVAVIALVYNARGEVLLLRQNYISAKFHNLVSGYVTGGEDAETCARREILEETGLEVTDLRLVMTSWFDRKEMLMIGFIARAPGDRLTLSSEVDAAEWCAPDEILSKLSDNPRSASRRLALRYLETERSGTVESEESCAGKK